MPVNSAQQIWVVRHTKLLLVSWFMGLVGVAVCTVLWPAFDRYVERLKNETRWHAVQAEQVALDAQLQEQNARLDALEMDWPVIEFQSLTAEIGAVAEHIDVKRTAHEWIFILTGESSTLMRLGHSFAAGFSGTRLTQLSLNAEDQLLRMTVRLQLTDHPVRKRAQSVNLASDSPDVIRFGEIDACPPLKLVSRFGDSVHIEEGTGQTWMQFGDRIDGTWQLIGIREGQLMLKSDIGGVCFSEAAF